MSKRSKLLPFILAAAVLCGCSGGTNTGLDDAAIQSQIQAQIDSQVAELNEKLQSEALQQAIENAKPVDSEFAYNVVDGEIVITIPSVFNTVSNLTAEDDLVIPAELDGLAVTGIGTYAFRYGYHKSLQLPDTLKTVADGAFEEYRAEVGTIMPSALAEIGASAFKQSSAVRELSLPNAENIGEEAFFGCYELTSVTLSGKLKSVGNKAFFACEKLTDLTIAGDIPEMGEKLFGRCFALTNVNLGDGLKKIGDGMFSACTSLASIKIPDSVSVIGVGAFEGCESLVSIVLPSGLSELAPNAFAGCKKLNDIEYKGRHYTSADDVLSAINGTAADIPEADSTAVAKENENDGQIYSPLPEIVNAKLSSGLIQIGDEVFKLGGYQTVDEFVEKYKDKYAFSYEFIDRAYIQKNRAVFYARDEENDISIEIEYMPPFNDEEKTVRNCKIISFYPSTANARANTWLPGGIKYGESGNKKEEIIGLFEAQGITLKENDTSYTRSTDFMNDFKDNKDKYYIDTIDNVYTYVAVEGSETNLYGSRPIYLFHLSYFDQDGKTYLGYDNRIMINDNSMWRSYGR